MVANSPANHLHQRAPGGYIAEHGVRIADLRGRNGCAEPSNGAYTAPRINPNFQPIRDLPAFAESLSDLTGTWGIARVRHNQSSTLQKKLASLGFAWCVPLVVKKSRRWGDHMVPLFAWYAPVCCEQPEDLYEIGQLDCVCGMVSINDQKRFVRELTQVHKATREMRIDSYPFAVKGRCVRVYHGPFMGFKGRIEERNGDEFVVLNMEIMGAFRPVSVRIEDCEADDAFVME